MIEAKDNFSQLIRKSFEVLNDTADTKVFTELDASVNEQVNFKRNYQIGYFNKVNMDDNNEKIYSCKIVGFHKNVIDLFYNHEKDSFIKFYLDNIFDSFRGSNNIFNNIYIKDYIKSQARIFIQNKLNENKDSTADAIDFYEELNKISKLNYEGRNPLARLLIIDDKYIIEDEFKGNIKLCLTLAKPVKYSEHRKIRKLLDISDNDMCLIGNNTYIYGFGTLSDEVNEEISLYSVDFIGRYNYKINLVNIDKDNKLNEKLIIDIIKEIPNFKNNNQWEEELEITLKRTFFNVQNHIDVNSDNFSEVLLKEDHNSKYDEITKNIEGIKDIVKYALKEKSGTTIVITANDVAIKEINRLKVQANVLENINLINQNHNDLEMIIRRITSMDGALYLDIEGNCYSMGTVLDGVITNESSDDSKYAIYNSAVNYYEKEDIKGKAVIIAISEDGIVNVVPNTEEQRREKNKLLNEFYELYSDGCIKNIKRLIQLTCELIRIEGKSKEAYYCAARIYREIDIDKAIVLATKAIKITNGNEKSLAEVYAIRAVCYMQKKQYDNGENDINEAIRLDVTLSEYHYLRGICYLLTRQHKKAKSDFDNAILLNSNVADYFRGRAECNITDGDFICGKNDIDKAIALDPKNAEYYIYRGIYYYKLKDDYINAISDFNEAEKLNYIDLLYMYYYRALSYFAVEEYELAKEDLDKVIAVETDKAKHYYLRAQCYMKQRKSDLKSAKIDLDKAISLDENNSEYYKLRAMLHFIE